MDNLLLDLLKANTDALNRLLHELKEIRQMNEKTLEILKKTAELV